MLGPPWKHPGDKYEDRQKPRVGGGTFSIHDIVDNLKAEKSTLSNDQSTTGRQWRTPMPRNFNDPYIDYRCRKGTFTRWRHLGYSYGKYISTFLSYKDEIIGFGSDESSIPTLEMEICLV